MRTAALPWQSSVSWSSALYAGLLTGLIFLILPTGNPWTGSGLISPTIMGREIALAVDGGIGMAAGVALIHFVLSALYGMLLALLLFRYTWWTGLIAGGFVGFALYVVDYFLFTRFFDAPAEQSELTPIVVHIAFGIIATGAYKGLARRAWAADADGA